MPITITEIMANFISLLADFNRCSGRFQITLNETKLIGNFDLMF